MPNRPVENILRERLGQHPTPLDTDALWNAVEPRLPEKKPVFALWKWLALGLVLLGSIYFFLPESVEGETSAVASPAPVVVEAPSKTSFAPAAAPPYTSPQPASTAATPSTATPQEKTVAPISTTAERSSLKPREAGAERAINQVTKPTTSATPVVVALPVQEAALPIFRQPAPAAIPKLPLPKSYEPLRSRYAAIAAPLPKVTASAPVNNVSETIRHRQPAYWTLEPGIALSNSSRSVNAVGNTPNEGQAHINNQYESALEAISIQGLIGYHHPSGLSLRTGVTHNRINSKVASQFTTVGTESVETIVAIIESPNGSRSQQTGIVEVATETTIAEQYYNSVSSLDVPLLLGYRFGGTKWGLTVEAGPSFNLSNGGRVHLYDGEGNYRLADDAHFRTRRTEPGFLANFGGAYNLSKTAQLTANLRVQGSGNGGVENPSVGYATRYTLMGVQVGYRLRF